MAAEGTSSQIETITEDPRFGGVPTVLLRSEDSECTVALGGATALSWKVKGKEQFYVVPEPKFVAGKTPFRGGVPICWPAFATKNPKAGKHGFVQQSARWKLVDRKAEPSSTQATMEMRMRCEEALGEGSYSEANGADLGPSESLVVLRSVVTLSPRTFHQELQVLNGSKLVLPFSGCLHTYFLLDSAEGEGFDVVALPNWTRYREPIMSESPGLVDNKEGSGAPPLRVTGEKEIERLYSGVPFEAPIRIGKHLEFTRSSTFPDVVVWNIGDSPNRPGDMPAGDVPKYVCVEPGVCDEDAVVRQVETWKGHQTLVFKG
uniref:Glucose-6-phosphate 1-epimerase n=1 Tax=Chromera velia CCMP2878 TaxID=1169474 RepID=A0A0G4HQ54_9ALVE|eukprot:Cvel_7856.t1-p1 / transcript=Cvel_7856.t1 / gene=Cvel_7856 / organism=Chromera_velia_CCMP2878 / gene_product=hypothetical protein / transcript_product=hypothetical protein / location=Cvel_scaffold420:72552-73502(+) / protein_length=317 / sequence_SO=supercontig / SO=protein_coding / is_pseudo=false